MADQTQKRQILVAIERAAAKEKEGRLG